jgi:ATP-binding protein involved in chromosome partitioning
LFGSPAAFRATADRLGIEILAELPLVPGVSAASDQGIPYALVMGDTRKEDGVGGKLWNEAMAGVAENVWNSLR